MSGGIAQLVAVGAQDAHLVGQPEVSFFRSTYKRATNFSVQERQVIQGNIQNNGMSSIRFERRVTCCPMFILPQFTPMVPNLPP